LRLSHFKYESNFFELFLKILKKVLDKYMHFVYFCIVQNKQNNNEKNTVQLLGRCPDFKKS
jgi:hypothetical protein